MAKKIRNYFARDQKVKFLVDDALFADTSSARIRAVNQLARDYGRMAISVINEIVHSVPSTNEEFRLYCFNVIEKITEEEVKENTKAWRYWV